MSRIISVIREMCPNGIEFSTLADLGSITRGKRFVKTDLVESGAPCIHYGELYTKYGVSANHAFSFISLEHAQRLRKAQHGDVVIASAGETVEDIGKAVAWLGSEDVVIHDACYAFRSALDPTYVAYFLQTDDFHKQIRRHISTSKVSSISTENLGKVRIPVPPLAVQREIARVLDALSTSSSSLGSELEKELLARRQQYSHHRDALLTFNNTKAEIRPLGEVVRNLDSKRRPITRAARTAGQYPYYGANGIQDHVSDYIFDGTFLLMGEDGSVVKPGGRPILNWATGKIWVNNHAHVLVETSDAVRLRYLFHYLQTVDISPFVTGGMQPKLNQGNMNRIPVAVPSVDDQERIAHLLDELGDKVNELSSILLREIKARRAQYHYFRDRLLTFQDVAA